VITTGEKNMTDRKQFEAMLEALINEDTEQAKEIFHNIVVSKSREIYEELLSEDFDSEEAVEEEADEEEAPVDEEMEGEEPAVEAFGDDEEGDDEEGEEADDDVGGDATDDMIGDVDADADGEEEMDDEEQTDRILDLEDALEELKAEFEQLMAGEEGDDMGGDDMGDMGGDDMGDMGGMDAEPEIDELQTMMEYVNKVGGATYDKFGKMGDDGVNTKSIVAGKNDMGGTTANIAKSFSTDKGGTEGGLASPKAGDLTAGLGNIHNRKDSKAGKTAFTKKEPGHGAEKKGAAEKADNKTSMINGAPGRAK